MSAARVSFPMPAVPPRKMAVRGVVEGVREVFESWMVDRFGILAVWDGRVVGWYLVCALRCVCCVVVICMYRVLLWYGMV